MSVYTNLLTFSPASVSGSLPSAAKSVIVMAPNAANMKNFNFNNAKQVRICVDISCWCVTD